MKNPKRLFGSKLAQVTLAAIAFGLIARMIAVLAPQCNLLPETISPWLVLAVFLGVGYRFINAFGWALVLRALYQTVDGYQATRLWLRCESRRWLPGGIWGYTSRANQAVKLGVPLSVGSASMLVELLLTMGAAILLFIPLLLLNFDDVRNAASIHLANDWQLALVCLIPVVLALASFMSRKYLIQKVKSVTNRFSILCGMRLNQRYLWKALAFYLLMGCLNGGVTYCLIKSLPIDQCPPIFVVVAATSFSWVVGFLAIFAPSGMVVRETTFAACLVIWLPFSTALAIAVLARVIQLVAELVVMAWAFAPTTAANRTSSWDCNVGEF